MENDKKVDSSEDIVENNTTTEETKEETTEKKSNKTAFIVEAALAIIAIIIIIVAVLISKNGSSKIVPNETYGPMPSIPEVAMLNPITEDDAKAKVANNEMIQLKAKNGANVYVANYKDQDKFLAATKASQEDIDEIINTGILAGYSDQAPIEGRTDVQMGDTINIDYVGTIDGVAFEGGTGNYDLTIGSHSFIDTFEDQLVGAKKGDVVEVNVTFPENYGKEELNGQPALFTVTVNELLYTSVTPELTDEIVTDFFSAMGEDITTVDGCIEYCTNYIEEYNTYGYISEAFYTDKIDNNIVTAFYNDTIGYYESMATNYGTDLETMLATSGATIDDVKNEVMTNSAQSALYIQVISSIADDLNVKVTNEDLTAFAVEQGAETLEEYYETYGSKDTLQYYALEEKVIKTLKDLYK